MTNTTIIYTVTNNKETYTFKTSAKNNHSINLTYRDCDGEYKLNTYDLENDLSMTMKEMRDDFEDVVMDFIKTNKLCKTPERKYIRIDFENVMREFIGMIPLPDISTVNMEKGNWLKSYLATE